MPPILPPGDGFLFLDGAVSEPAWRTKPSWYLVSTEDRMIPPDAQRAMSKRAGSTVVEAKGNHAIYVSQPKAAADLIVKRQTPSRSRRRRVTYVFTFVAARPRRREWW